MNLHDGVLFILAFLSEVLGTLSGFGSSTFFVPIATWVESMQMVLVLTGLLHCFGNSGKIFLFRQYFQWKYFTQFALPAIIFTGVGAILNTRVSLPWAHRTLGLLLIVLPVFVFWMKRQNHALRFAAWQTWLLCALSGFLTGLVGTGGAIRGLALAALGLNKNIFVMLSSSMDLGGDILRTGIYLKNGYMDWSQWFYLPLLGIAAIAGSWIGQKLLNHVSQAQFEKIVMVFVFLSGCTMLIQAAAE